MSQGIGHSPVMDEMPVQGPLVGAAVSILSYNVYLGQFWDAAAAAIEANPADIVVLQEVADEDHPRDFVRPSVVRARFTGMATADMLWGASPRRVGNMTLSARARLGPTQILHAPPSQPYGTWQEVELAGARFVLANIHLAALFHPAALGFAFTEHHRAREARDLRRRIADCPLPVVAVGDFNSFRGAPAYRAMAAGLRDCRRAVPGRHAGTRPTYGLPFVIDHAFVTPDVGVLDYRVIRAEGSDHRPLLVRLRVPAA